MVFKHTVILLLILLLFAAPLCAEPNDPAEGSAPSFLTVDAVSAATASEKSEPNYRLHRTLGYLTMAGVTATGLLGWLAPGDFHAGVAVGTTGLAAVTTGLAVADFARAGSLPLPHIILTGLGTVGFMANLFIEPRESDDEESQGSNLHSILGAASASAFALGVTWVIVY